MSRYRLSVYLLILIVLLSILFPVHGSVLLRPYLQAVTMDSIYVLMESVSQETITVEYGPSTLCELTAETESFETTTESTYVHNIKLTGLKPETQYYYQIQGMDEPTGFSGSFVTPPLPGKPFRFAWMADCRTGGAIHDAISAAILKARPRFSLYGGDLCKGDTYKAYKKEFFRPNELALIADVPFFNAVGNHEKWTQNTRAFTQGPSSASGDDGYYSFDYGDLHVVVVNTELPYKPGSTQYNFIRDDLTATKQRWKIVTSHKPAYCAGGHGEDSGMKTLTKEVFEPTGVDLVLTGHSHFYQHNLVRGIHHLIIGSAGADLYLPETAPYTVKSVQDFNYAIVDLSPSTLRLVVYNHRGDVLDTLELTKGDV